MEKNDKKDPEKTKLNPAISGVHRIDAKRHPHLKTLQQIRDELVTVCHDIRNPQTVIVSSAAAISETAKELPPSPASQEIADMANEILCAVQQITTIISNLSPTLSLALEGKSLNLEHVDITQIIKRLQDQYPNTKIHVIIRTSATTVEADASMIFRLLKNIIENSIKYAHTATTPIIITLTEDNFKLRIEIKDFGRGFTDPPEKLFQNNVRGRNVQEVEGSGVGLAFCRTVCTLHKGTISAGNNEYGIGSTITITLPFKHNKI